MAWMPLAQERASGGPLWTW